MAKLEVQNIKKQKGKKRKHSNAGNEDEVANKSVIVEPDVEAVSDTKINEKADKKATKKRKNADKGAVKEKRSKSSELETCSTEHDVKNKADIEDLELRQPTLEELKESEKPENNLAIVTGRQKKKQKRQNQLAAHKDQSVEREKLRNEEYLNKWKNNRKEWKFEKLRQISIQQTLFEANKLSSDVWTIALEYLAGTKGAAKDKIVKMANEIIDDIDKLCENAENEEDRQVHLSSVKYQRARDLLQIFD